jgi:hypothetical protein
MRPVEARRRPNAPRGPARPASCCPRVLDSWVARTSARRRCFSISRLERPSDALMSAYRLGAIPTGSVLPDVTRYLRIGKDVGKAEGSVRRSLGPQALPQPASRPALGPGVLPPAQPPLRRSHPLRLRHRKPCATSTPSAPPCGQYGRPPTSIAAAPWRLCRWQPPHRGCAGPFSVPSRTPSQERRFWWVLGRRTQRGDLLSAGRAP